jgi:hypothetical protein
MEENMKRAQDVFEQETAICFQAPRVFLAGQSKGRSYLRKPVWRSIILVEPEP